MPPITTKSADDPATAVAVRRILCLGLSAGYIDAVGFLELGGIYIAAMTGNSVQLGISLTRGAWPHVAMVALTIGSFFIGGLLSSYIRRRRLHPGLEIGIMAALVLVAQIVRILFDSPLGVEVPLLAVAMAMQGQTLSRFGGAAVQTIVVTNNLLKFADALVGRAMGARDAASPRVTRNEVILPGCAWISYVAGAAGGAWAALNSAWPLLPVTLLLLVTALDLLLMERHEKSGAA